MSTSSPDGPEVVEASLLFDSLQTMFTEHTPEIVNGRDYGPKGLGIGLLAGRSMDEAFIIINAMSPRSENSTKREPEFTIFNRNFSPLFVAYNGALHLVTMGFPTADLRTIQITREIIRELSVDDQLTRQAVSVMKNVLHRETVRRQNSPEDLVHESSVPSGPHSRRLGIKQIWRSIARPWHRG
jgi:hypothetical protein